MQVDIYISEAEGSREVRIPWLPNSVQFATSEARLASYEILDLGEVNVPSGSNLEGFVWEATLPGKGHQDLPFLRGEWTDPLTIQNIFIKWKKEGTKLRLMMTGTPINHDVYLLDFQPGYEGGYGDVPYSIEFKARRDLKITKKVDSSKNSQSNKTTDRKTNPETYTVKKGDTLWGIAQKYLGSGTKWPQIYNLNKSIIESTAKKYGKKSSDGGHWIYPGCSIRLK